MTSSVQSLMAVGVIMPAVVNPLSVAIDRLRATQVTGRFRPFSGLPFNIQKGCCKALVIFPLKDLLASKQIDPGLAGGVAGSAQVYLTGPFETKFSREAVRGLATIHGIRDAYSGALTQSCKAFVYWGVFFKSADLSQRFFEKDNSTRDWAIGGFMAAVSCSPLSVLATNRRVSGMNVREITQTMFKCRGVWGFFRPTGLEVIRSVIAGIGTRFIFDQFGDLKR